MYHIIVNPKSSSGRGARIWTQVRRELVRSKIPFDAVLTRSRGHAVRLSAKLTGQGWDNADTLVVVGGDGTLNEVLDGICLSSSVTVGYIPTGSGNDFARGTGMSADPMTALEHILHPSTVGLIDVGQVSSPHRRDRFAISTGIGFDAAICHAALSSPVKNALNRFHLGKLTYAALALRIFFTCPLTDLTVSFDHGNPIHFSRVYFAAVMNLPYEGGGLKFCPHARRDDGMLDVLIVSGVSRLHAAVLLLAAFAGKHTHLPGSRLFRCRSMNLKSSLPLPVHTDGESAGIQSELFVTLEQTPIRIILS